MRPLIEFATAPTVAWANGLGRTTELVSWERSRHFAGPDTAPWRLSIAELAGPAPFSPLPGVRRYFLPVGGSVMLTVDGVLRWVRAGTFAEFAGDDEVALTELADGPCHAVNLMVRAGPEHGRPVDTGPAGGQPSDGPVLTVGPIPGAAGCLVAVALGSGDGVERFDVLDPSQAAACSLPVALVGAGRPRPRVVGAPVS